MNTNSNNTVTTLKQHHKVMIIILSNLWINLVHFFTLSISLWFHFVLLFSQQNFRVFS